MGLGQGGGDADWQSARAPTFGVQKMKSSFESFIDRAFWSLLLGVSSFGVKFLHDLSQSVDQLNQRMVSIVSQLQAQSNEVQAHTNLVNGLSVRVDFLERITDAYPDRVTRSYRLRKK